MRPGVLTDDPGTGLVKVGPGMERGRVPRDDVAATLVAVLDVPTTIGKAFTLVEGDVSIDEAVRAL